MRKLDLKWWGIGLSLVLAAGCSAQGKDTGAQQEKVLPVQVQTVTEGSLNQAMVFTGTAEANAVVQLSAKTGGRVTAIPVKVGQTVNQNDILLQLDDTDLRNAVRQSEAGLNLAKANLDNITANQELGKLQAENAVKQTKKALDDAKVALVQMEPLFHTGAISKQQYEQAKNAAQSAEVAYQNAQANLSTLEKGYSIKAAEQSVNQAKVGYDMALSNVGNSLIRAPYSGTVAAINTEVGQNAAPGSPVITLINQNSIKVKLEVTESALGFFQAGGTANIRFDSLDLETTGKIESISPTNSQQSKGYPVIIVIDNPDAKIKPGMIAKVVSTNIEDIKTGLKVPSDSIVTQEGQTYVYVADGETAIRKKVNIEVQSSSETIVSGELLPGDKLIVKGQTLIKDGVKIRIIEK